MFCFGLFFSLIVAVASGSGLTIYNQNFAVVRDSVALDLKVGENDVVFDGATVQLEPDSVILRDPAGNSFQIFEQNYRNDPISQGLLLSLFEGKEIDFSRTEQDGKETVFRGKIIRSGYMMSQRNMYGDYVTSSEPIIEVDGKVQFGLPGKPIFPSLGDDTILKPRLAWKIRSDADLKIDAELNYITGGLSWQASYNAVAAENVDTLDLIGWVTMNNQCGRNFDDANIKLMAGDVSKIRSNKMDNDMRGRIVGFSTSRAASDSYAPVVTEKTFDEYHLYTLSRPTTLRDKETKQVEFVRASGIKAKTVYVYDGMLVDWQRYGGNNPTYIRDNEEFGSQSQTKVAVMKEFENTKENGLGIPLPKGRLRFYRADGESLEFTGENEIDHTPADETMRIYTGNAFDLVGARKRTDFQMRHDERWCSESFEIKVSNRKKEPVTVRIVEHLFRWTQWKIISSSEDFVKNSSTEIVFEQEIPAGEKKTVTYKVEYTW